MDLPCAIKYVHTCIHLKYLINKLSFIEHTCISVHEHTHNLAHSSDTFTNLCTSSDTKLVRSHLYWIVASFLFQNSKNKVPVKNNNNIKMLYRKGQQKQMIDLPLWRTWRWPSLWSHQLKDYNLHQKHYYYFYILLYYWYFVIYILVTFYIICNNLYL